MDELFVYSRPATSWPWNAPPRTPVTVSWAAVHGCGPDGGAVVGDVAGDVAGAVEGAVFVGRGERVRLGFGDDAADVAGSLDAATADDDGAAEETTALELGGPTAVDAPDPPTDEVHAAAVRASPTSPAASGQRLNCRSAGRSSTAGCSAAVPARRAAATTSPATPSCR